MSEQTGSEQARLTGNDSNPNPNPNTNRAIGGSAAQLERFLDRFAPYIIAIIALVLAYFVGWIIAHGFAINLWVMHRGDDRDSCESPMLAIWLGVAGIVGIIVAVFWIMFVLLLGSLVKWGRFVGERQPVQLSIGYYAGIAITLICVCVLGLFMFAWQITGSVWTYRIDRYNHKCPNDMYNFAFWYITIAWVSGAILYLILVILIVIGASTTASKARTDDSV